MHAFQAHTHQRMYSGLVLRVRSGAQELLDPDTLYNFLLDRWAAFTSIPVGERALAPMLAGASIPK